MAIHASKTDFTNTSPPISTILPSSVPPIQLQNVYHHIFEKLTQDNYILWQFLMVPFLKVKIYSGMSMKQLHDPLSSFSTPHPVS
jgi:hypothetical protein